MTPTPTRPPNHDPRHAITTSSSADFDETAHASVSTANMSEADMSETDAGPPKANAVASQRKCIGTGAHAHPADMVRFVVDPDGQVAPDIAQRLPGRGAWTLAQADAVTAAIEKKAFNRAFKRSVKTPEILLEMVENLLAKRTLDLLGFAKRAGDLILGFDKVREEIRKSRPACLVEAADGALDGRKKIVALARAAATQENGQSEIPVIGCFSARELGLALGRDRVIHAVLKQGRFAKTWLREVHRLSGFRPTTPETWLSRAD